MKVHFILPLLIMICGCDTVSEDPKQELVYSTPPPPPLPLDDQRMCDSLKSIGYAEMDKGAITIACYDTITDIERHKQFVSILKNVFGFSYFRLNGVGFNIVAYKRCIQPIMDSAIAAKYGKNAKDSFVNIAYRTADAIQK
ncbi:MAG: hypothetical protein JNM41_04380 [Flavipsychrobacter sp.]|nr:hypothetical protein [Flavipsychrobacter sp.]